MVNGWKYWCNTDLELCAKFVLSNVFPGVFADNETGVNICLKDAGDNVNNDDPNNILSPINGHCGGGVGEATAPYWKAIQDNSTGWPEISMTTGKVLNRAKVPPVDIHPYLLDIRTPLLLDCVIYHFLSCPGQNRFPIRLSHVVTSVLGAVNNKTNIPMHCIPYYISGRL